MNVLRRMIHFIYRLFMNVWDVFDSYQKPDFRIISIEGNIGSGKTTILKQLMKDRLFLETESIVIVPEPVEKWEALKDPIDGESVLSKFYKEPQRYGFMLQIYILETMIEAMETAIVNNPQMKLMVCERSILTSMAVFSKLLLELDYLTAIEQKYLERLVMEHSHYFPDDIIYLDVPVDICMERIKKRNRTGESEVTIEYLEKWENRCKEWLFGMEQGDDNVETVLQIPHDETMPKFPLQIVKDVLHTHSELID